MHVSTYYRLSCLLTLLTMYHTGSCMDSLKTTVLLGLQTENCIQEYGSVIIHIDPHHETEVTLSQKILAACKTSYPNSINLISSIIAITQASRTKTPISQLIDDGLGTYKQLLLRALLQSTAVTPAKVIQSDDTNDEVDVTVS